MIGIKKHVSAAANWFTAFDRRKLEWGIAGYTIYFGGGLLLPVLSMSHRNYSDVLTIMSEGQWGATYLSVGVFHSLSLHVNGRAAWTPFARLASLFLTSQVFLSIALGLFEASGISAGFLTYSYFTVGFCGIAIASAAHDCGREYKIWRSRHGRD